MSFSSLLDHTFSGHKNAAKDGFFWQEKYAWTFYLS